MSYNICVYASSSAKSPDAYKLAAKQVGKLLSERNHTCINGGGSFGCMGALNDACSEYGGKVLAVIHEMWVNGTRHSELHPALSSEGSKLVVVGGETLAERKKRLNEFADAYIVLPGGFGSWDELFEVACEKQIGIGVGPNCPIVILNVNGYYDGIVQQMKRGYEDNILYKNPFDTILVVDSPLAAVDAVEKQLSECKAAKRGNIKDVVTDEGKHRVSQDGKDCLLFLSGLAAGCALTWFIFRKNIN